MSSRVSRSVYAYIVAEILGSTARLIIATAIGKEIYDVTHSTLDLGWLGLIEFAPSLALMLVAGAVADRFDRRRIAALALTIDAGAAVLLAWDATSKSHGVLIPFLLVGLVGLGRAFFSPALRSLPADIVAADRVPWLTARYSIAWQASQIIGPIAGGFLYAASAQLPFTVSAIFYGFGAMAICLITFSHAGGKPVVLSDQPKEKFSRHNALEGARFIRKQKVLLGAISLDLFAVLFGGAVALLPAIAQDRLHVGAIGLGWLRAAVGIGASSTTLLLVFKPLRRHVGRALLGAVAIFGIFTLVLGATRNFALAFIAILVLSGADSISVFVRSTLVPLVTPTDKRGRVMAIENVFIGASNELGAFESGMAATIMGTALSIVFGGAMTLAIAVIWAGLFPQLRDQDRFPEHIDDLTGC